MKQDDQPIQWRKMLQQTAEAMARDAGDDRADLDRSLKRTENVLRLMRAEMDARQQRQDSDA